MKVLQREKYLSKLMRVALTPDIKVLTGVRRCGKSMLLEMFVDRALESWPDANIIHINFNNLDWEDLKEYHALHSYVERHYQPGVENFVFIDEVQMCPQFELAVNSLHDSRRFNLFVTGSNAFLLSSDLATLFTGRTFQIPVYPFSLAEFMEYFGFREPKTGLERYVREGGMPGSYVYAEPEEQYRYIADVFDTRIVRDIRKRHKIRNSEALLRISNFLMDNISNLTSANRIAGELRKNSAQISDKTAGAYIQYLCDAYAFYPIRRYDVRGKRFLTSRPKYYLSDHIFRYAKLGTRNMDFGRVYENMVAIELLRRGYDVSVGTLYRTEIDFVAERRSEKIYIQVCDNISSEQTFDREYDALMRIPDAYPKMILANTGHEKYGKNGVQICDLAEWLAKG